MRFILNKVYRIICACAVILVLISLTQCESFSPAGNKEYNSVYAHVMNYSKVIRLEDHDLWGVGVNNYGCGSAAEATKEVRKLLWEGDSFSASYTMTCDTYQTITTRIDGTLSSDRNTLVSFSGNSVWRISSDTVVDNRVYTQELSLRNVPLEKGSDGELQAMISGSQLSQYVDTTYFSFQYKHENRKPETFQEVTRLDLSDAAIELNFILSDK